MILKKIASNVGIQLITQLFSFIDRFIIVALLIRVWGAEVYADWVILLAAAAILATGELGMGIYFGNKWQGFHARGNTQQFIRYVRISLFCYGTVVAALCLGAFLYGLLEVRHMNAASHALSGGTAMAVFLCLAGTQISSVGRGSISQVYRGFGQFAHGTLISSTSTATSLAAAFFALNLGMSPLFLAALYLACDLFGTGLMVWDIRHRFPQLQLFPTRPRIEEFRDLVRTGRWNVLLQGSPVLLANAPILILGHTNPKLLIVGFVLMRTISNYLRSLISLISIAAAVEIVPFLYSENQSDLRRYLDRIGIIIACLAGSFSTGALMLAEPFLHFWSGKDNLFDTGTFAMLIGASVVAAISNPLLSLFMLSNTPKPAAIANLLLIATTIGVCLAFSYPAGAAAGMLFGELVASGLFVMRAANASFGICIAHYLTRCLSTMMATAAWCWLVLYAASQFLDMNAPLDLLAVGVIFAIVGVIPTALLAVRAAHRSGDLAEVECPNGTR